MEIITSLSNQKIKNTTALHNRKYRAARQEYLAEGTRVLQTLIESGHNPTVLFVTQSLLSFAQKIASEANIVLVTPQIMKKISLATTPSGILGVFPIPTQPLFSELTEGIVLVEPSNPGNIGTIIRSAAAMNKKTVITVGGVDPWNPKVIQSSAGTIGKVNIWQMTWQDLLTYKKNLKLFALVVSGGESPSDLDMKNSLLVLGNEAHGLPEEIVNQCEGKITLPMPGKTESLNMAVAGSIALYQITL